MSDINLLPWRQSYYVRIQRKKWMVYTIISAIWVGTWILLHHGLLVKNDQLNEDILLLKNKMYSNQYPAISSEEKLLNEVEVKQKIFFRWFRLVHCLGGQAIQLNKMDYNAHQIFLSGYVASMISLSDALSACHLPIDLKITIIPVHESDFLRFSIGMKE